MQTRGMGTKGKLEWGKGTEVKKGSLITKAERKVGLKQLFCGYVSLYTRGIEAEDRVGWEKGAEVKMGQ